MLDNQLSRCYNKDKKKEREENNMRKFKVIKINKETKEVTTIVENEEFIEIARMTARNNKDENHEVKIINMVTNEEVAIEPKKARTYDRNYKDGYRICRNNFIRIY